MLNSTDSNITAFPGDPSGPIDTGSSPTYGLQPGTSPLLAELADTLRSSVSHCSGHAAAAAAKAALRGYVCEPTLLDTVHKAGDLKSYRRHLLYAAPEGNLSILALVWMPGQLTPVHGHRAWGTVGVYEGKPFCESFARFQDGMQAPVLRSKMKLRLKPGDLTAVRPGIDDLHRIGNDSARRCITIHAYGHDLLASPGTLNINFL